MVLIPTAMVMVMVFSRLFFLNKSRISRIHLLDLWLRESRGFPYRLQSLTLVSVSVPANPVMGGWGTESFSVSLVANVEVLWCGLE